MLAGLILSSCIWCNNNSSAMELILKIDEYSSVPNKRFPRLFCFWKNVRSPPLLAFPEAPHVLTFSFFREKNKKISFKFCVQTERLSYLKFEVLSDYFVQRVEEPQPISVGRKLQVCLSMCDLFVTTRH